MGKGVSFPIFPFDKSSFSCIRYYLVELAVELAVELVIVVVSVVIVELAASCLIVSKRSFIFLFKTGFSFIKASNSFLVSRNNFASREFTQSKKESVARV